MGWIRMRTELMSDPTVIRLSRLSGLTKFDVLGRLYALWAWADANTADGKISLVDIEDIGVIVGDIEFARHLRAVKWLGVFKWGVQIPEFDKYNGDSAKARALKNQRQARWRSKKPVDDAPSTPPSTGASTRGEEIRGDKKTLGVLLPPVASLPVDKSKPDGDKSPKSERRNGARWWDSNEGIDAKARDVGVQARAGESYVDLKRRVFDALNGTQRASAA